MKMCLLEQKSEEVNMTCRSGRLGVKDSATAAITQ